MSASNPRRFVRQLGSMTSADGLSFQQLEEELRAAEAYLSNAQAPEQYGQSTQDAGPPSGLCF